MYGVQKKSVSIVEPLIKAQIHFALAIKDGMCLGRWQGIIIRKVTELIRPRFGSPPQWCKKFKMQVAALCFSNQSHEMVRLLYCNTAIGLTIVGLTSGSRP